MPANFPTTDPALNTSFVDGVDDVLASDHNQDALETNAIGIAARRHLLIAELANTETLAASKTLVDSDPALHYLDPGGTSRDVTLPAEANANHAFWIVNTADDNESLVIKSDAPATIITIQKNETGLLVSDGTAWQGFILISTHAQNLITTAGDVLYGSVVNTLARLAIGTAGQVLTVNSGATAPEWAAIVGKNTIWIPATAMRPTSSNGCASLATVETTAGRPDMNVLDFDKDADEHAQFDLAMPKRWNEGTVTFKVYWTNVSAVTTGVAWGLQGVAVSDNGTINVVYGSPIVVTDDSLNAAEDLMATVESEAMTIAGDPAEGDLCFFRIFRDIDNGNDDLPEDARLIGMHIYWTSNALNDA